MIKEIEENSEVVSKVAFNQNGTRLASGTYSGTIKIWNTLTF